MGNRFRLCGVRNFEKQVEVWGGKAYANWTFCCTAVHKKHFFWSRAKRFLKESRTFGRARASVRFVVWDCVVTSNCPQLRGVAWNYVPLLCKTASDCSVAHCYHKSFCQITLDIMDFSWLPHCLVWLGSKSPFWNPNFDIPLYLPPAVTQLWEPFPNKLSMLMHFPRRCLCFWGVPTVTSLSIFFRWLSLSPLRAKDLIG